MGGLVNHRLTTYAAVASASVIIALNVFLLYKTFVG
jgi:Mn2+/Fe2+ NRAMP family transporter